MMKRIIRNSKIRDFHQARWNEPIINELGHKGERGIIVPQTEEAIERQVGDGISKLPQSVRRKKLPNLPEINQKRVLMHYLRLSQETLGGDINIEIGQGTCTVKYNPTINNKIADSEKMTELHPLQDESTVQGILEIMYKTDLMMREISGMDYFSFQPGGGSQATMTMASIVRMYHRLRGEEEQRDEIITTIYSHPSDAAAPALKGYKIIKIMTDEKGHPDYEAFKAAVNNRTAAFVAANPEDTGIFNPRIKEFTDLVTKAGGLNCYDQANANGLFGVARAKEAGFQMCYFNLHKSFGTPHGCGGPGSGAVGVIKELKDLLPKPLVDFDGKKYYLNYNIKNSIGKVKSFIGTPQVVLKAYSWIMSMGAEGLYEVAKIAVLNNVYLIKKLLKYKGLTVPYDVNIQRIEQARYSMEQITKDTGIGIEDITRRVMDFGTHIWSSHHPFYIPEPITLEPTESPSKEDLDEYIETIHHILDEAYNNPEIIHSAPNNSTIHQVDESSLDDTDEWCPTWRVYLRKTKTD
jgi:glycine dehydrogenase subunit 2